MVNGNEYHIKGSLEGLRFRQGANEADANGFPWSGGYLECLQEAIGLMVGEFQCLTCWARLTEGLHIRHHILPPYIVPKVQQCLGWTKMSEYRVGVRDHDLANSTTVN